MAEHSRLNFRCPWCGLMHQKEIDANVINAKIGYRCAQNEAGCGKIFWLSFALDWDLEVETSQGPPDAAPAANPVKNGK